MEKVSFPDFLDLGSWSGLGTPSRHDLRNPGGLDVVFSQAILLLYSYVQLIIYSNYLVYNNTKLLLQHCLLLRTVSTKYKPNQVVT